MTNTLKVTNEPNFEMRNSNLLSDSVHLKDKCLKMALFGGKSTFFSYFNFSKLSLRTVDLSIFKFNYDSFYFK